MGDFVRGTRVYVGGLSEGIKKDDIDSVFRKYGKLNSVWVAFNPPGFAFVEFQNKDDALAAVDSLNHSTVLGPKLRVEISRGRGRSRGGGSRGGGRGGGGFRSRDGERGYSRGRGYDRGGFRGRGGRYDDYDSKSRGSGYGSSRGYSGGRSSRDEYDRDGYGSSRGDGYGGGSRSDSGYKGSRGTSSYPSSGARDGYETNGYYDSGKSASRYRSRSPVGHGSSRDKDSFAYGRSDSSSKGYSSSRRDVYSSKPSY